MEKFENLKSVADSALMPESKTIVDMDTLKESVEKYRNLHMEAIARAEATFPWLMAHLSQLAHDGARKAEIDVFTDREGVQVTRDASTGKVKGTPTVYVTAMSGDDEYSRIRMMGALSWLLRRTRGIARVSNGTTHSIVVEW